MIDRFAKRRMAFLIPHDAKRTLTDDGVEFSHSEGVPEQIEELVNANLTRQEDDNGWVKYRGEGFRVTLVRDCDDEATIECVELRFYGDQKVELPEFLADFCAQHQIELFDPRAITG